MLEAVPNSWFSWDFTVMDGSRPVAEIDVAGMREKGLLTVEGTAYKAYREGLASGAFILESDGSVLVRAEKPSAFRRSFIFEYGGREYTLRAESALGRRFLLLDGPVEVGSLVPKGFFSYRTQVDLPEHLPLPVRIFIIWLTVILWKRDEESAASG